MRNGFVCIAIAVAIFFSAGAVQAQLLLFVRNSASCGAGWILWSGSYGHSGHDWSDASVDIQ